MKKLIFIAVLCSFLLASSGCDLTPSQSASIKAKAIFDGAEGVVVFGLQGKNDVKVHLKKAATVALGLLQDPEQTLQTKHWEGLLVKLDDPRFEYLKAKLLEKLYKYCQKPIGKAVKKLNKTYIMYLTYFFKGIISGCDWRP